MKTTVTIFPSHGNGTVAVPASKSVAHRLLICAGLAKGESVVRGLTLSEDVLATIDCLRALGATVTLAGDVTTVTGCDPKRFDGQIPLSCRESGSTLRFFLPIAALSDAPVTLCGSEKLLSRPEDVYADLFGERNLIFEKRPDRLTLRGPLPGGVYRVRGDVSSQFVSGLLFALPLAGTDSRIELIPPVASLSYVDLTLSALAAHGIRIGRETAPDGAPVYLIPGNQTYTPGDVTVEGDYSNAAFPDALNLLGGNVTVTGLSSDSVQGDRVYKEHFAALVKGFCEIDLNDCPDLGPILFTLAALFHGARFTGTGRLRIKESDRVAAMAEELSKCGVILEIGNDTVTVPAPAGPLHAPEVPFDGHNDHRVVMSMAILSSVVGGTIVGAEAVGKSYPGFFGDLQQLGIEVQTDGMDL